MKNLKIFQNKSTGTRVLLQHALYRYILLMTSRVLYFHCELQLNAGAAHVNLRLNRVHMSKGFVDDFLGVKMLIL